jgi:G3E family GTPase
VSRIRVPQRTPVHIVTGMSAEAMAVATMTLQWDLPGTVVVEHRVDGHRQQLSRVVSDITGRIEHDVLDLEHACLTCAIREDMIPTLDRLSATRRWESVLAVLAPAADASAVCRIAAYEPHRHRFVVASVTAAFEGSRLGEVLLGDALLVDSGVPVLPDDERGVAEAAAPIAEYADHLVVTDPHDPVGLDALRALARPGVPIALGSDALDTALIRAHPHHHAETEHWAGEVRRGPVPLPQTPHVWTMELSADRPLHPQRLNERFEELATGSHRARGCLWVATRPVDAIGWEGAGGHHLLGPVARWSHAGPLTRVIVTGRADHDRRAVIRGAFEECLVTDSELAAHGPTWRTHVDGLEPWLGPIHALA